MLTQENSVISGTTAIGDEGIKKHFKTTENWEAIFELIWNGFDAKAENVKVNTADNQMGGSVSAFVFDDGDGIDPETIEQTFGKFNESAKGNDAAQHGAHGRGRLAFHKLARSAIWFTKTLSDSGSIEVSSETIKNYTLKKNIPLSDLPKDLTSIKSGTVVELVTITSNLPNTEELLAKLSIEFGWYLVLTDNLLRFPIMRSQKKIYALVSTILTSRLCDG
jgi:hypothetical protein